MIASNLPGGSPKFSKSPLPRKERRMAGRKMGETERVNALQPPPASRKVQVFLKRFTDPRASASADPGLSVSSEVTSSAGGRTAGAAIYLCKFTAEKIQPERKVSDGWVPHF